MVAYGHDGYDACPTGDRITVSPSRWKKNALIAFVVSAAGAGIGFVSGFFTERHTGKACKDLNATSSEGAPSEIGVPANMERSSTDRATFLCSNANAEGVNNLADRVGKSWEQVNRKWGAEGMTNSRLEASPNFSKKFMSLRYTQTDGSQRLFHCDGTKLPQKFHVDKQGLHYHQWELSEDSPPLLKEGSACAEKTSKAEEGAWINCMPIAQVRTEKSGKSQYSTSDEPCVASLIGDMWYFLDDLQRFFCLGQLY